MYRSILLLASTQRRTRPISRFARSALAFFAISLASIGAGVQGAFAQQAASPWEPQLLVTPYLWLPGVYATINTPLERAPQVNKSLDPINVLGDLTGAPFTGSAEVRYGPFGLVGDLLHVVLGTNFSTHNVFYSGG